MAVREEQDRRVDLHSEKLLTLEEAARHLGVPADDLEAMIREKRIPAFRLDGHLLRVRWADVKGLRASSPAGPPASEPSGARPSPWERIREFLYFNDFYLVAFLILLTLLAIILTL